MNWHRPAAQPPTPPMTTSPVAPTRQIIIDAPPGYVCVTSSDMQGNTIISFQADEPMQQVQPSPHPGWPLTPPPTSWNAPKKW